MVATSGPVNARGRLVPRGMLGMVILVALAEWFIGQGEPAINGIEPWDWRRTGQVALDSPMVRSASVLCFGDSLVKLGVQPQLLAAGLGGGRRAYNLALCAGRAPASYFLLRRVLAAGAKPAALVVDFNDAFLTEPPETTLRLYVELLNLGETRELARTMGRPDFASTIFASWMLPSARNRFEIRQAISDIIAGRPRFAETKARSVALRHNWQRNLGAQVMPKLATPLSDDPATWTWFRPLGWTPDPTNAAYVAAFFDLAAAHQIPVFWLLPPVHPGLAVRRGELGLNALVDAFVARMLIRFPGVVVVEGRGARYDPAVFIDMAHLDRDGSARLSADLAAVLAETLAHPGPRVVALPAFATSRVAACASPAAH